MSTITGNLTTYMTLGNDQLENYFSLECEIKEDLNSWDSTEIAVENNEGTFRLDNFAQLQDFVNKHDDYVFELIEVDEDYIIECVKHQVQNAPADFVERQLRLECDVESALDELNNNSYDTFFEEMGSCAFCQYLAEYVDDRYLNSEEYEEEDKQHPQCL